jgi:hypothetical protein
VIAHATIGTALLAAAATSALLIGKSKRLELTGAGAVIVILELEAVWHRNPFHLELAVGAASLALLSADELRSWALDLERSATTAPALRRQLNSLALRLAGITAVLALLILAARTSTSGPLLGFLGAGTLIMLFAGLLTLARRTRAG